MYLSVTYSVLFSILTTVQGLPMTLFEQLPRALQLLHIKKRADAPSSDALEPGMAAFCMMM